MSTASALSATTSEPPLTGCGPLGAAAGAGAEVATAGPVVAAAAAGLAGAAVAAPAAGLAGAAVGAADTAVGAAGAALWQAPSSSATEDAAAPEPSKRTNRRRVMSRCIDLTPCIQCLPGLNRAIVGCGPATG